MSAEIVEKVWNENGEIPVIGRFLKVSTSDWIVFGDYPGVINYRATLYTGADDNTLTFGTALIDISGSTYGATDTTIVIKSGKLTRKPPYYVQTSSGEIIYVITDSAPTATGSTLTVLRGCLGTTASATGVSDGDTLYIRNIVVHGKATSGYVGFVFTPMPSNPKAPIFYTSGA